MDDILAYLEEVTHPETQPPEYFSLLEKMNPYSTAVAEKFSLSFWDGISEVHSEVSSWLQTQAFARGFRLGVQLILAAQKS